MLALYRAGRQAEALAAYRDARQALVERASGSSRAEELQELERAILRQDPSLEAPAAPPSARRTGCRAVPERKLVTVLVADLEQLAAVLGIRDPERAGAFLDRLREELDAEIDESGGRVESVRRAARSSPSSARRSPRRITPSGRSTRRSRCGGASRRRFGDSLSLRVGVATGEAVVGEGAGVRGPAGRDGDAASRTRRRRARCCVGPARGRRSAGAFEFGAPKDPHGCRPLLRALSVTRPRGEATALVGRATRSWTCSCGRRTARAVATVPPSSSTRRRRRRRRQVTARAGALGAPPRRVAGAAAAVGPLPRVTDAARPTARSRTCSARSCGCSRPTRRRLCCGGSRGREILGLTSASTWRATSTRSRPRAPARRLGRAARRSWRAERPVVLFLEDLHWAHEPLLDLVERLVDEVSQPAARGRDGAPGPARRRPAWGRRRDATTCGSSRSPTTRRTRSSSRSTQPPPRPPSSAARSCSSGPRAIPSSSRSCSRPAPARRGDPSLDARTRSTPCWRRASTCCRRREGGAAGGLGDRPHLLARPAARAARRRRARPRASSSRATSSGAGPARRSPASASSRSSTRSRATSPTRA